MENIHIITKSPSKVRCSLEFFTLKKLEPFTPNCCETIVCVQGTIAHLDAVHAQIQPGTGDAG
jgi:hypothetical protein